MQDRLGIIESTIKDIYNVKIVKSFVINDSVINGSISVFVIGLTNEIVFDVLIYPQYPFKIHDSETIFFINKELLGYSHIMGDGSICIHTAHSPNLNQKILYDIESVKAWIKKYYIDKDNDTHYEHIVVPEKAFKNKMYAYFFNAVGYSFRRNQYGYIDYSQISNGLFKTENITSSIIQRFSDKDGKLLVDINWNIRLKSLPTSVGIFIFLENAPAKNKRFAFQKWEDFKSVLQEDFLFFLHSVEEKYKKNKNSTLPLLVGYRISSDEIHWQTIMLEIGKFPIFPEKQNQKWFTRIDNEARVDWAITKNCSPKYFFGRGKLEKAITESKILIIGIGAIGSMIARTFVKCGCTKLDLIDYDVKEPENVCRSEYSFITGVNNKTLDLLNELYSISPFFKSGMFGYDFSEGFNFYLKSYCEDDDTRNEIEEYLNHYDLIIDCTTDNDLLYILSQLKLTGKVLNISISNHAKQLVCAVERNRYEFVVNQFQNILDFDIEDLHNPTGCWNPTFKASYNDISVLVQFAIKHLNSRFAENALPLRNFVLETEFKNNFEIKIKEF